ncbi:MAG: hypothetical protein M1837_003434 [Sclerophora amabilis]|nr:MAG: hypothetical protein M1837_003434 [Sclerophora amabilis]
MSSIRDNKWVWVGLGVFSYVAFRTIVHQLHQIPKVTEVSESKSRPRIIDQDTEDALKLDTLRNLAGGSNHDLRGVAAKIICERSASGPAFSLLLQHVASPVPFVRDKALVTLRYLSSSAAAPKIQNHKTLQAVVTALVHILRDPARASSSQRYPPERNAMTIVSRLLPYNIPSALRAGIVKRWLAHYPFGTTESETRATIKKICTYNAEDHLMSEIVCILENHPDGRKQMRLAGLTGSAMDEDSDGDERMVDGEETAGLVVGPARAPPLRRFREESLEEQRLRRRRREAMVLSDGAQPLGRRDIIQRDDGAEIREEEVERELEELMDQVRREESEMWPQSWRSWLPWATS